METRLICAINSEQQKQVFHVRNLAQRIKYSAPPKSRQSTLPDIQMLHSASLKEYVEIFQDVQTSEDLITIFKDIENTKSHCTKFKKLRCDIDKRKLLQ